MESDEKEQQGATQPQATIMAEQVPNLKPISAASGTSQSQLLGGKSTILSAANQIIDTNTASNVAVQCLDDIPDEQKIKDNLPKRSTPKIHAHVAKGVVGLENFSNNCYMNVVLQILANIAEVKHHFVENLYLRYINADNSFGSGGQVVKAFADVVKALWSGRREAYRPTDLKVAMGRKLPMFLGYQQCDAQEFLAALLDNLHEDLNQAKAAGACHSKVTINSDAGATEKPRSAWLSYLKRNNSHIVHLFHGQMVSKLTCITCGQVSLAYDPFAQISLPIPVSRLCLSVIFFHQTPSQPPSQLTIPVANTQVSVGQLKQLLGKTVGIPSTATCIFLASRRSYGRLSSDSDSVSSIMGQRHVVACECYPEASPEAVKSVACHQRLSSWRSVCGGCKKLQADSQDQLKCCTGCYTVSYCSRECQTAHWRQHKPECCDYVRSELGLPFVIPLCKEKAATWDKLSQIVIHYAACSVMATQHSSSSVLTVPFLIKCYMKGRMDNSFKVLSADKFDINLLYNCTHACVEWYHVQNRPVPVVARSTILSTVVNRSYGNQKTASCTLKDCLDLFMGPEELSADQCWRCSRCKKPRAARKELAISRAPHILSFHIKRFAFGGYGQKLSENIDYPINGLDMSPYMIKENESSTIASRSSPILYDLIGVISHRGSLRMGHYTCMARLINMDDNEETGWRFFDDDDVRPIQSDRVQTSDAYVLVYRMRGAAALCQAPSPRVPVHTDHEAKERYLGVSHLSIYERENCSGATEESGHEAPERDGKSSGCGGRTNLASAVMDEKTPDTDRVLNLKKRLTQKHSDSNSVTMANLTEFDLD